MAVLTVIIPTMPGRESPLSRLLHGLSEQDESRAEILVLVGRDGLGDKINRGLQEASGRLSVLIDDDDEVAADFLSTICDEAMAHKYATPPEFIGYHHAYLKDGVFRGTITYRLDGDPSWTGGAVRGVHPKCPFLTEKGRLVEFGNHYVADQDWSAQMTQLLVGGAFIDRHMYRYDYWRKGSTFTGNGARKVGMWPFDRDRFRWIRT